MINFKINSANINSKGHSQNFASNNNALFKQNSASMQQVKNKDSKAGKILKTGVLVIAGLISFFLTDLFLAKGKISSKITKSKQSVIKTMSDEIDNVVKQDGYATKSRLEAFLSVPGLHAIWNHRLIHKLYEKKVPIIPRFLQNISRFFTGIEIHPGAKIGKNIFIDHSGAIIGQTAQVGNNVTIIGRVVLGSTGKGSEYLRHTIVEDGTVLGMNSVMLGRIKIGQNSKIGAGAIITHNVPANSTVIGNPAVIIAQNGKKLSKPVKLGKINN